MGSFKGLFMLQTLQKVEVEEYVTRGNLIGVSIRNYLVAAGLAGGLEEAKQLVTLQKSAE